MTNFGLKGSILGLGNTITLELEELEELSDWSHLPLFAATSETLRSEIRITFMNKLESNLDSSPFIA